MCTHTHDFDEGGDGAYLSLMWNQNSILKKVTLERTPKEPQEYWRTE